MHNEVVEINIVRATAPSSLHIELWLLDLKNNFLTVLVLFWTSNYFNNTYAMALSWENTIHALSKPALAVRYHIEVNNKTTVVFNVTLNI